jgi:hypothetical protein
MTKYFIIFLAIYSNSILAQNNGHIKLDSSGDAENPNIVISGYDAIIESVSQDSSLNTIYEIRWQDNLTDGSFYFRIIHNMIYLREGHNNPNHNNIYWAQPLSSISYDSISTYLKSDSSSIIELQHKIFKLAIC